MSPLVALVLSLGIVAELVATTSLKMTDGFARPWWLTGVIAGYLIAFYCFAVTLKTVPLGPAYAMWAGMGIVGSSAISVFIFRQDISWGAMSGMALILVGTILTGCFAKS